MFLSERRQTAAPPPSNIFTIRRRFGLFHNPSDLETLIVTSDI